MRTGLVLGAGGVVGGSWLVGALQALEAETGWAPTSAETIVGTSAGSVVGALTAQGLPPALMAAYIGGGPLDGFEELAGQEAIGEPRLTGDDFRPVRALPGFGPGSWRMALTTLAHPLRHAPSAVLSGWLPRGFMSTQPISALVERFVPGDWPDHPGFRTVACDYATGRRVCFGRPDSPRARVGDAVAASCAIPGFYRPVTIEGRRYVDGGVCSVSNLDLLAGAGLDLVVCLNPMSSLAQITPRVSGDRFAAVMRGAAGRRLGHEARKVRERGARVVLLQPTADDLAVMGVNFMARDRREQVIGCAARSTARQLRRLQAREGSLFPAPARARRPRARRGDGADSSGAGESQAA